MPELPEIAFLTNQLKKVLPTKIVDYVQTNQAKSLNIEEELFHQSVKNQEIVDVSAKGKWLKIHFLSKDYLAINLGMGGEIYYNSDHQKVNAKLYFTDESFLTISFWWFGHVHFCHEHDHHTIDELGLDLIHEDICLEDFTHFISSNRGAIKNVLLDQRKIAGIGNYYIHDILFEARIHPLSKANKLPKKAIKTLYHTIIDTFIEAIEQNGSFYEQDIYAHKGNYKADLVAYKEDEPCPNCKTLIKKIKTSSTTSYICPNCQSA